MLVSFYIDHLHIKKLTKSVACILVASRWWGEAALLWWMGMFGCSQIPAWQNVGKVYGFIACMLEWQHNTYKGFNNLPGFCASLQEEDRTCMLYILQRLHPPLHANKCSRHVTCKSCEWYYRYPGGMAEMWKNWICGILKETGASRYHLKYM